MAIDGIRVSWVDHGYRVPTACSCTSIDGQRINCSSAAPHSNMEADGDIGLTGISVVEVDAVEARPSKYRTGTVGTMGTHPTTPSREVVAAAAAVRAHNGRLKTGRRITVFGLSTARGHWLNGLCGVLDGAAADAGGRWNVLFEQQFADGSGSGGGDGDGSDAGPAVVTVRIDGEDDSGAAGDAHASGSANAAAAAAAAPTAPDGPVAAGVDGRLRPRSARIKQENLKPAPPPPTAPVVKRTTAEHGGYQGIVQRCACLTPPRACSSLRVVHTALRLGCCFAWQLLC